MIIVMEPRASQEKINRVVEVLTEHGFKYLVNHGEIFTTIDAFGDKTSLTADRLNALDGVKEVKIIREPFRLASRDRKSDDTIIEFPNGVKVGGKYEPVMIVGPCSVEKDYESLQKVARSAVQNGCQFLRGGAFKPRTSPYDFQGYEEEALKNLKRANEEFGLLTVTEVMDSADLELVCKYADVVQIGARNMQNFKLLKSVGKCNKPVILKRGLSATIREFLLAAEHIMYAGNDKVILCERGIRSFDNDFTRNVMDLAAVPVIKKLSHLPIIVDPSHATGQKYLIEPMTKAGLVVGADGVMIEVHNDPENALSDGKQSLSIEMFNDMMTRVKPMMDHLSYEKSCLSANIK